MKHEGAGPRAWMDSGPGTTKTPWVYLPHWEGRKPCPQPSEPGRETPEDLAQGKKGEAKDLS